MLECAGNVPKYLLRNGLLFFQGNTLASILNFDFDYWVFEGFLTNVLNIPKVLNDLGFNTAA